MKEGDTPSFKSPLRCAGLKAFCLWISFLAGAADAAPDHVNNHCTYVGDGALDVPPSTEKLGRQPQKARSVRLHMQEIAFSLPSPAGKTGAAAADPPCRECRLRPSPKGLGRAKRRGCGDCVLPSSAPGSGRPQSPARRLGSEAECFLFCTMEGRSLRGFNTVKVRKNSRLRCYHPKKRYHCLRI